MDKLVEESLEKRDNCDEGKRSAGRALALRRRRKPTFLRALDLRPGDQTSAHSVELTLFRFRIALELEDRLSKFTNGEKVLRGSSKR